MDYLDFEIQVEGNGLECIVSVDSPAGQARQEVRFPLGELELKNNLLVLEKGLLQSGGVRRKAFTSEQQDVQGFGRTLFNFLFPGEVLGLYRTSMQLARGQGKGLRLKLHFLTPAQASLPWEFLYDAVQDEYICLSSHTPLVRYLKMGQPPRPLSVPQPLRILGMIAEPKYLGLKELKVDIERQRLEAALQPLIDEGRVELEWLKGQTWRDLQWAMHRGPWHIFHFIGHGAFDPVQDEGVIYLADSQGQPAPLTATQLGRLLGDHISLRLVVLNACEGATGSTLDIYSSTASILMRRGLSAVLAMQYEISDGAAIEFISNFYEALAKYLPIDAAVTEARKAITLEVNNSIEWGTPVLHMRAPDGVVFEIGGENRGVRKKEPGLDRVETVEAPPPVVEIPAIHLPRPSPPIEFDWVRIPAGEFTMGSDKRKDGLAFDSEQPQHQPYLPEFHIARTPVTNAQFTRFVEATNYRTTAEEQGSSFAFSGDEWEDVKGAYWAAPQCSGSHIRGKETHPVVHTSWHDAMAFCQWAGVLLPSEVQWEKAARSADGRIYPWGNNPPMRALCNYNHNVKDTTPVGNYPMGASPYGCLDMAGNVLEWTITKWRDDYKEYAQNVDNDPVGDARRVLRGGAFVLDTQNVRCACRYDGHDPDFRSWFLGFRVVSPTSDALISG